MTEIESCHWCQVESDEVEPVPCQRSLLLCPACVEEHKQIEQCPDCLYWDRGDRAAL